MGLQEKMDNKFAQISDTEGVLLAEAMAEHMAREEWEQLDSDQHYAGQVWKYKGKFLNKTLQRARFEKHFSLAGFGRRIDEAIDQIFANEQQEKEMAAKEKKLANRSGRRVVENGTTEHHNGVLIFKN